MSKGKSPAFQFYASDFYMDTLSWSDEMVGLHIRLLCQQWINGNIESSNGYPSNLSEKQKLIFDKIKHKYFKEKNGFFKNKKLENIKKNKDVFIKNARKAGMAGALKRWGKDSEPYSEPYSENIALHSSSSSSINKQQAVQYLMSCAPIGTLKEQCEIEAEKMAIKYKGQSIGNLKALCNKWAATIIPFVDPKKNRNSYV